MERTEFESLVADALDSLPEETGKKMENVVVVVENYPTNEQLMKSHVGYGMTLLGLYEGLPRTKRGFYNAVLPDKITIFAGPILQLTGSNPDAIRKQVAATVVHEVAHHFGMTEEEVRAFEKNHHTH